MLCVQCRVQRTQVLVWKSWTDLLSEISQSRISRKISNQRINICPIDNTQQILIRSKHYGRRTDFPYSEQQFASQLLFAHSATAANKCLRSKVSHTWKAVPRQLNNRCGGCCHRSIIRQRIHIQYLTYFYRISIRCITLSSSNRYPLRIFVPRTNIRDEFSKTVEELTVRNPLSRIVTKAARTVFWDYL